MSQGRTDDPEVSAALSEFLLMQELPQFDLAGINALRTEKFALYVAQAELAVEQRNAEAAAIRARTKGR